MMRSRRRDARTSEAFGTTTGAMRDVELMATGADRAALANRDMEPALARLSGFHGDRGIRAFGCLDRAMVALARNASVKIVADWVALNL